MNFILVYTVTKYSYFVKIYLQTYARYKNPFLESINHRNDHPLVLVRSVKFLNPDQLVVLQEMVTITLNHPIRIVDRRDYNLIFTKSYINKPPTHPY